MVSESARGAAFGGVAGEVVRADVGFGFDDAGAEGVAAVAADEDGADEVAGDGGGVGLKEVVREPLPRERGSDKTNIPVLVASVFIV